MSPLPALLACPICRSNQIQVCRDYNNPEKDQCKCRVCGCKANRIEWNNRVAVSINQLDKLEWQGVFMHFLPDASQEDFEAAWAEFQALRRFRTTN